MAPLFRAGPCVVGERLRQVLFAPIVGRSDDIVPRRVVWYFVGDTTIEVEEAAIAVEYELGGFVDDHTLEQLANRDRLRFGVREGDAGASLCVYTQKHAKVEREDLAMRRASQGFLESLFPAKLAFEPLAKLPRR